MKIVPDFFVVGAQKAGTTALHDWLVQQPDVCLPSIKETHYFSHDARFQQGPDWYARQFPDNRPAGILFGEVDPEYLFYDQAPIRIRAVNPAPKFVFLLRQPLERAYSHYLMSVRRGYEDLSFEQALRAETGRLAAADNAHAKDHQSYLSRGFYAQQINRFRETFPNAEFHFVKFEDLISKTEGQRIYAEICKFLGVRSSPELASRDKKSNQASVPRSRLLRDFLYQGGRVRKLLGKLVPSRDARMRIGIWLDKLNQKPIEKSGETCDVALPQDMKDRIRSEIVALEALTALDCRDWLQRLDQVTTR